MSSFDTFKASFKGDLVTESDPNYKEAIARWSVTAERKARIVAFVRDAEDVSSAIKYAVAEKLPVAIRGGGHNPAGTSSSENGLVIDLSKYINGVTIDPAKKTAKVGGGALWETVDKSAIEHGLAGVGGTVNHTGVAGLTLGGGWGWLTGSHGLVIDNLLQATMVTADGSILTANETENSDLFWGIRGAGSNFGVCTEFVFQLHDQRRTVFAGMMIFPEPAVESVLKTTKAWWDNGPSEKESMIQLLTRAPHGNHDPIIAVIPFYNGSEEDGRKAFKAFFDLKPVMDTCSEIPYEKMNALQNEMVYHGQGVYMRGATQIGPHPEVSLDVFKRMAELSSPERRVVMVYEYVSTGKLSSVPKDAMAFAARGPHNNVVGVCFWDGVADSAENRAYARDTARELTDIILNGEKDPGAAEAATYSNYADVVDARKSSNVFGSNYPRLQQLKKKYDPDMVFNKWLCITPA